MIGKIIIRGIFNAWCNGYNAHGNHIEYFSVKALHFKLLN